MQVGSAITRWEFAMTHELFYSASVLLLDSGGEFFYWRDAAPWVCGSVSPHILRGGLAWVDGCQPIDVIEHQVWTRKTYPERR